MPRESAIEVQGLGKRYRIGVRERRQDTIVGAFVSWLKAPAENLRKLKQLSTFGADDGEDVIWALRDVSFRVMPGEVLGVIGHNGAGKSTLLKILSRITEPSTGWAEILGRISSLLEVGTGFHQDLTGRENVYLNGTILGMTRTEIDRKFDEIVAFSGVERFIDTPVKRYSSGMKVRLAFSVAAHLEPEILLIDEVLAVGDAAFQKKSLGKMNEVAGQGRTVLFVSHNMVAVQNLCPRAIRLHEGRIVEDGESEQVIKHYLSAGDDSRAAQRWERIEDAPGDDTIRIHQIRVVTDAASAGHVDMESGFQIQVDYWNRTPDAVLNVTLKLLNEQGIVAFTTGSGEGTEWERLRHPVGLFRSTCHIPGHLLNSGTYHVKLLAVKGGNEVVARLEQVIAFEVIDAGTRTTGWYGKEQGVVRPWLRWETVQQTDRVGHLG
jgi:lipopolysaccharide transport system ATP-binding protein